MGTENISHRIRVSISINKINFKNKQIVFKRKNHFVFVISYSDKCYYKIKLINITITNQLDPIQVIIQYYFYISLYGVGIENIK